MISQDIAAWRDSELETCTPTDWYSTYLLRPNLLHNNFRGLLLSFRGHTTLHVKTVLYNPHTRTQGPLDQCSYVEKHQRQRGQCLRFEEGQTCGGGSSVKRCTSARMPAEAVASQRTHVQSDVRSVCVLSKLHILANPASMNW